MASGTGLRLANIAIKAVERKTEPFRSEINDEISDIEYNRRSGIERGVEMVARLRARCDHGPGGNQI